MPRALCVRLMIGRRDGNPRKGETDRSEDDDPAGRAPQPLRRYCEKRVVDAMSGAEARKDAEEHVMREETQENRNTDESDAEGPFAPMGKDHAVDR